MDEWTELGGRVVELAAKLVAIPSVVDTDGEAAAADFLSAYLREAAADLPHVSVRTVDVPKPTACRSVWAHAMPPTETSAAFILLGHLDTVGLEPYDALRHIACDSAALKAHYASAEAKGAASPELAAAAASPDWAFGRGWLDMKGGVAAITEVFLREARRRELPAHLLLLLTADEESASRGLRALLPELAKLKRELGLQFKYVVNADYTAPLSPTDTSRYLYTGTVGKLLVGISIFGRPTHVGEPFGGLNAAALAGFLAGELEHDRKLLSGVGGEWLPPPTVLHVADHRERYDVMTPEHASLYFNAFHVGEPPPKLWRGVVEEVRRLTRRFDRALRLRYNRFSARANVTPPRHDGRAEVISYSTLLSRAAKHAGTPPAELQASIVAELQREVMDDRECALAVVHRLHDMLPPARPMVIVTLLPPFYPAWVMPKASPAAAALQEVCTEGGLKLRRLYPYIADMSYFAFGRQSAAFAAECPLWLSKDELALLEVVAAPVLNLGPVGVGAHTSEERVYLPYLRDALPRLLSSTLHRLSRIV